MNLRAPALFAAACLVLCAATGAPRASAAPAPTTVTLKNGLRVVLAPDSAAMAVDVAVWYPAGTRAERAGLAGASHLAERLMFRGSATVPDGEHVRRILAEGGSVNTQMSPDYACFWQTVPAEAVPLALRLEAARMTGLSYGAEAFEAERRAARADLRGWRDRPVVTLALAQLRATLFEGHPYGRLLYGSDADLARMTAKDFESWRRGAYAPGAAVLTIVGRFDAEATLALVRRTFESLPKGSAAALPAVKDLAPGERRGWTRENTPARLLLAGWRVPPASDPDAPAFELLAQVLGGGEKSRLNAALVQDWHAALLTQAGVVPNREASMFWAMAALGADADSSTAERALLDQVGRLAREAIPGDELDRARAQLLTGELFRLQTVHARAQALGEAQVFAGDPAVAERRLAQLAALTPADLQRAAQRVLTETTRAVVWLAPREEAGQ